MAVFTIAKPGHHDAGALRKTRVSALLNYPGGVALRFARVLRYRPDKTPAEADDLDAVRALLAG